MPYCFSSIFSPIKQRIKIKCIKLWILWTFYYGVELSIWIVIAVFCQVEFLTISFCLKCGFREVCVICFAITHCQDIEPCRNESILKRDKSNNLMLSLKGLLESSCQDIESYLNVDNFVSINVWSQKSFQTVTYFPLKIKDCCSSNREVT